MNVDKIATRNSIQLDIPFELSINRITMPNRVHYHAKNRLFSFHNLPSISALSVFSLCSCPSPLRSPFRSPRKFHLRLSISSAQNAPIDTDTAAQCKQNLVKQNLQDFEF